MLGQLAGIAGWLQASVSGRRSGARNLCVKDDRCVYYIFSKKGEFIRMLGKGTLSKPFGLSLGDSTHTMRSYFSGSGEPVSCGPLVPSAPRGSKCRFVDVHDDALFVLALGHSCVHKTACLGNRWKPLEPLARNLEFVTSLQA